MTYGEKALKLHKEKKGKIEISSKVKANSLDDLSVIYTPGVGAVSSAISRRRDDVWEYTNRGNTVAIVSDGTSVLGLGNLGPRAAIPVMEGKSVIFKKFANIDAVPLCIDACEVEDIVKFCKQIEPSFGGINLEDIAAPRCFEILDRLESECDIAVFHDDQDGTAIVILAGMINACRVTGKILNEQRVIINGAGAAGIATARLLIAHGVKDIILLDSIGVIYTGRRHLNIYKKEIARETNPRKIKGMLRDAIKQTDIFIGLSKGNLANKRMVRSMNDNPIIFAMANPIPEIMPDEAKAAGASIIGTGRSDFPNQINNALVFPGVFKGLLDGWKRRMTTKMKLSAAIAISYTVKPSKNKILPNITDKRVVDAISRTIIKKK